ncbi:MAG: hydrogenase maturation protease [Alphaproteobacteria bacterium]|nr:hydrogenase maturation protease [Alphaproteobacteria bacterium]
MGFLFLGVGNRNRGDDAVGPMVAEALADNEDMRRLSVEVLDHSGEGVSLMDLWRDTDLTVIVDAMKSGAKIGTLRRFDANADRLIAGTFRYSSHLFGLSEAVEMSRAMKRLPKSLIIYGIEGIEFSFGASLSPEVEAAMHEVKDMVLKDFINA